METLSRTSVLRLHIDTFKLYDHFKLRPLYEYFKRFSLNPEYDQAMNNLGNLLKDQGKNEEAEQLLRKAVEIRWISL